MSRPDSCQVGVFVGYTVGRLRVLLDRALYLPRVWTADRSRCAAAGVPDGTRFATRSQLALAMIRLAVKAGLAAAWVTADEAYGRAGYFRAGLRNLGLAYVVVVACDQRVRQRG